MENEMLVPGRPPPAANFRQSGAVPVGNAAGILPPSDFSGYSLSPSPFRERIFGRRWVGPNDAGF